MRYMGSKNKIVKFIVPIIQQYIDDNNIDTYIEPFVGGANVIDKIKCKNKYGYDINKYLIALLKYVANDGVLYKEVSKNIYDKARTAYNNNNTSEYEDWEIGNIGFLASYNGRFFDGGYAKTGYEKTKNGLRLRDYYREQKDNIMAQAENLKDIYFEHKDFIDFVPSPHSCVIYCDIPYKNTKRYALDKNFNYELFWDKCRKWSKNHFVIISEQVAPDDFICLWEKDVKRCINTNNKFSATEKLFTYNKGLIGKNLIKN